LSERPARLHRLAELIPYRFMGSLKAKNSGFGLRMPPPPPPLYSVTFSSMYRNTDNKQTAINEKKAYSHLLVFTRDTRNRDKRRAQVSQTLLFNI
jgi:hypothetical protein